MFKIEKDLGHGWWHRTLWYKDEEMTILHRGDGPAIEWADGTKYWFLNGKRHRIDGPAGEAVDGDKEWWLNDQFMEFSEWKREVRQYYETDEDYLLMLLKL